MLGDKYAINNKQKHGTLPPSLTWEVLWPLVMYTMWITLDCTLERKIVWPFDDQKYQVKALYKANFYCWAGLNGG